MKRFTLIFRSLLMLLCMCSCKGATENNTETTVTVGSDDTMLETTTTETEAKEEVTQYDPSDWRSHPEDYKLVAFTFDDAPGCRNEGDNVQTRLVELFNQYEGAGTFFVTGNSVEQYGVNFLQYAIDHGFELGNHTYHHTYLTQEPTKAAVRKEIEDLQTLLAEKLNYTPRFLRPGYVAVDDTVFNLATELNLPILDGGAFVDDDGSVKWLRDYDSNYDSDYVYYACRKAIHDGRILLLHCWSDTTDKALAKLIPELYEEGYRFVTVSELFALRGITDIPTDRLLEYAYQPNT